MELLLPGRDRRNQRGRQRRQLQLAEAHRSRFVLPLDIENGSLSQDITYPRPLALDHRSLAVDAKQDEDLVSLPQVLTTGDSTTLLG